MPRLIAREPSLIWDLIISHLIKTANYVSTPPPIRIQACETIADIVIHTPSFGVSNTKTSGLVRVAFPCLQLICTDFLSLLSPECLKQCINTLSAFGLQMDDLNISLTAIGLLWNVSDFIQTKRAEL